MIHKAHVTILFFAVVFLITFFFSCDIINDILGTEEERGAPKINSHKIISSPDFPSIELWWDWIEGAEIYEVHRACPELGFDFQDLGYWGSDQYFVDTGWAAGMAIPGHTYQYKVRTHANDGGFGPFGPVYSVYIPAFLPPENVTATLLTNGSIMVEWDPVEEAERYSVFRTRYHNSYPEIGTTTEKFYSDNDSFDPSTVYYYKVLANCYNYGDTDYSDEAFIDTGAPPITATWVDLGSAGFASAEGDIELASDGSNLYALFADASDTDKRIKAMTHDGSESGSWSDAGTYLSLGAAESDKVAALSSGSNLYAVYADTDVSVTSGGSPRLFVKQYAGSVWSDVGSAGGVSIYVTDHGEGKYGAVPALTTTGTDLFMVYQTDSGSLVDSLSYPGSGDYWNEEDSDYWYPDNMISASDISLDTDSSGRPVAALQSGGISDPVVNLYRYDGSLWAHYGSEFNVVDASLYMDILGFILDSDTPYLAFETTISGESKSEVSMWNGSAWLSLDLTSQISSVTTMLDLAIIESPGGSGIYAAVAYQDTGGLFKIELWEYNGSSWQQIGSTIDWAVGIGSIDVALDSSSRPILVFTEGFTGDIHAMGYRE